MHLPDGAPTTIYDAAMQYAREGVPLVVLAGKEYGSGSSRDWAAKGSLLLGVRAVLAESFERIHRSNLVGMGVLPLEFVAGRVGGVARAHRPRGVPHRRASRRSPTDGPLPARGDGRAPTTGAFTMRARIDTPFERQVFLAGGILPFTLRAMLA